MDLRQLIFGKPNNTDSLIRSAGPLDEEEKTNKTGTGISNASKKIKKLKREHPEKIKIKYIGYPVKLKPSEKCKRRYACEVKYLDEEGKERKKHVRFGNEGKNEYIDHRDPQKRLNTITKLKNTESPLESNFYKLYLLNSNEPTVNDAYINLITTMGVNA